MRFSLYRIVSGVFQFFSWVWLILLLVAAILVVAVPLPYMNMVPYGSDYTTQLSLYVLGYARWGIFVGLIVVALIGWAGMMAFAGILRVLISIETNTFLASNRPFAYGPPVVPYPPAPVPAPTYAVPPPPPLQPVPPSIPCPNCGAPLQPGDKYCQSCGKTLS
jgi:hypothetical protein